MRGVKMFSWHISFMLAVLRFALVQFADGVALQCMYSERVQQQQTAFVHFINLYLNVRARLERKNVFLQNNCTYL